jgi:Caspase domain
MRLRVKFLKEGEEDSTPISHIKLYPLRDLDCQGMKGAQEDVGGEFAEIVGLHDGKTQAEADDEYVETMGEDDWKLFHKLRELEINKGSQAKCALLIGGAPHFLDGIKNDLSSMAEFFIDRGFDITVYYDDCATRDGILKEWRRLVRQTAENNVVVVYYTGHGGIAKPTATQKGQRIQYIIPTDIEKTNAKDFRGILDMELSNLLKELTARTHNVTLILDCCHSELMARGGSKPKTWSPISTSDIENHILRGGSGGVSLAGTFVEGNPNTVRVVAAAPSDIAYEDSDLRMGKLTKALIKVIKETGDRVSWQTVLLGLRRELGEEIPPQRPQIEGPSTRFLFSLDKAGLWGVHGVNISENGGVTLQGGFVAGVSKGDTYAIMPFTADGIDPRK